MASSGNLHSLTQYGLVSSAMMDMALIRTSSLACPAHSHVSLATWLKTTHVSHLSLQTTHKTTIPITTQLHASTILILKVEPAYKVAATLQKYQPLQMECCIAHL